MSPEMNCPECGQIDLVRKVSIVHGELTRRTAAVGVGIDLATLSPVAGVGGSQQLSPLARMLAPPDEPTLLRPTPPPVSSDAKIMGCVAPGLGCLSFVLIPIGCITASSGEGFGALAVVVGLGLLIPWWLASREVRRGREAQETWIEDHRETFERADAAHAERLETWRRLREVWREALYCGRCDRVFLAGMGESFATEDFGALLDTGARMKALSTVRSRLLAIVLLHFSKDSGTGMGGRPRE
jgi:hypothetical protein